MSGGLTWQGVHALHDDLLDQSPNALVGRQRGYVVPILHQPACTQTSSHDPPVLHRISSQHQLISATQVHA